MIRGIDTAGRLTRETAEGLKALGYGFAGRYLVPEGYSKALTRAEAEDICKAGLSLLTVWETSADRVKGGAAAGAVDGARALACARALDMPSDGIIYFAVDYNAASTEMGIIEAYLRAARAQTEQYEIGVYGSFAVIEEMARRDVCKGYWQCVAWSGGKKSSALKVYQAEWGKTAAGISVDINECDDMAAAGIWTYEEDRDMKNTEESYEEFKAFMARYESERRSLPPDEYAVGSCKKAISSGIFMDGDGNGSLDYPHAPCKRQELAAVLDRLGLLGEDV